MTMVTRRKTFSDFSNTERRDLLNEVRESLMDYVEEMVLHVDPDRNVLIIEYAGLDKLTLDKLCRLKEIVNADGVVLKEMD